MNDTLRLLIQLNRPKSKKKIINSLSFFVFAGRFYSFLLKKYPGGMDKGFESKFIERLVLNFDYIFNTNQPLTIDRVLVY